jgi:hypothetical protein
MQLVEMMAIPMLALTIVNNRLQPGRAGMTKK